MTAVFTMVCLEIQQVNLEYGEEFLNRSGKQNEVRSRSKYRCLLIRINQEG